SVNERPLDRKRINSLGEVLARGLAQLGLGTEHFKDVVTNLEDHSEGLAEGGQVVYLSPVETRGQSPYTAGGRHQGRGLVGYSAQIVILISLDLERGAHLGDLALAEPRQRGSEQPGHLGA